MKAPPAAPPVPTGHPPQVRPKLLDNYPNFLFRTWGGTGGADYLGADGGVRGDEDGVENRE